jgi:uncharacterized membrane protein
MWITGIIVCLFILGTSLVLPWMNRHSIRELSRRVEGLQEEIDRLKRPKAGEPAELPEEARGSTTVQAPSPDPWPPSHGEGDPYLTSDEAADGPAAAEALAAPVAVAAPTGSFERQFGGRIFVWLGGVALVLAGVFLVQYSIEAGLLDPEVRTALGLVLGLALLGGGALVRKRGPLSNGVRIAQALSGAGLADLYVSLFAATNLYHLIPATVGVLGMAAVTFGAVSLSLWYGMPIAVFGLVGGFLTPALVRSADPEAALLFLYLYLVLAGLFVVIRIRNMWLLAVPAVVAAFVWVLIWIFGGVSVPGDSLWLGLFLLAVSATVVTASHPRAEPAAGGTVSSAVMPVLGGLTASGAMLLMGLTAVCAGFGDMDWVMLGILSAGGICLAIFDQGRYGLVPWVAMAVTAVMLAVWPDRTPQEFGLVLGAFALLYIVAGHTMQARSPQPVMWSGLAAATALGYYLLACFGLRDTPLREEIPMFWGFLALSLAGLSLVALTGIRREVPDGHPPKQPLMAIYAATVTAFLALGLTIELRREFLSVALAAEMLALTWIDARVDIRALRPLVIALIGVFGFLLVPQVLLIAELAVYSLVEVQMPLTDRLPIVEWPLFQLGAPALFFLGASMFLRRRRDDGLVYGMEIAAVALAGVMGFYLIRQALHVNEDVFLVKAGFFERGVITNMLFLYGLGCLVAGRRFGRRSLSQSGLVLAGIAVFRIVCYDTLIENPLWSGQTVGGWPILNGLALTYGLPILWLWQASRELAHLGLAGWSQAASLFRVALAFVFVSMTTRQFFHGTDLGAGVTGSAEIYACSAVWLVFGVGLLLLGTIGRDRMIRVASLPVLFLTVGKVFLFDASVLTGLWRVVSFFGLGLSLLGLGWFYAQYVFAPDKSDGPRPREN